MRHTVLSAKKPATPAQVSQKGFKLEAGQQLHAAVAVFLLPAVRNIRSRNKLRCKACWENVRLLCFINEVFLKKLIFFLISCTGRHTSAQGSSHSSTNDDTLLHEMDP